MNEKLESLREFIRAGNRVCPMPGPWADLWQMLPLEGKPGSGPPPVGPLILGAWYTSGYVMKIPRFHEHIEWAASQGVLAEVDAFLRGLSEEQWHNFGD